MRNKKLVYLDNKLELVKDLMREAQNEAKFGNKKTYQVSVQIYESIEAESEYAAMKIFNSKIYDSIRSNSKYGEGMPVLCNNSIKVEEEPEYAFKSFSAFFKAIKYTWVKLYDDTQGLSPAQKLMWIAIFIGLGFCIGAVYYQ